MLNEKLTETLMDRKILGTNSQVQLGSDSESFSVKDIYKTANGYMFSLVSTFNYKEKQVTANSITTIDGMDPNNLALAFDIAGDGNKVQLGKRRGRPLKVRSDEYWAKIAEKKAKTKKKLKIGRK